MIRKIERVINRDARRDSLNGNFVGNKSNLSFELCGFECPHCGFHHLLSDVRIQKFVHVLKIGEKTSPVLCPECGVSTEFLRTDFKFFGQKED